MPSTKINWQTNGKRITGESLLQTDLSAEHWLAFVNAVTTFGEFFGVIKLDFDIVTGTSPPEYTYSFSTSDNRKWKQRLKFDFPANPLMNFDVNDYFRLNEFEPQRAVRLALIDLVATCQLQTLSVRW